MRPPFQVFIFLSSEDDRHRVCGGIGTYIGLLTKTLKQLYSGAHVYWVTRSPREKDFFEEDEEGVKRYYVSPFPSSHSGFVNDFPFIRDNASAQLVGLHHKMEERVIQILNEHPEEKILIESGEWEGHGSALFRCLQNPRIFKVARVHTPLATCMTQNQLPHTSANAVQMLLEFETLMHSDVISSSTEFMKDRLVKDVFHEQVPESIPIVVIPNPVDVRQFSHQTSSKQEALAYLETLFPGKFNKEDFHIFLLGSVEKRKGVQFAIKAVEAVVSKIPQAHFCFFGHHADKKGSSLTANQKFDPEDLYAQIPPEMKRHVSFFGYLPHEELPNILAAADLFPILSLGDNFPGTVAEIALSKGTILALERGGVREMLTNENGDFVAYSLGSDLEKASARLVEGIETLYNDLERRVVIGRDLADLIQRKYEPQRVVVKMMEQYRHLHDLKLEEKRCILSSTV